MERVARRATPFGEGCAPLPHPGMRVSPDRDRNSASNERLKSERTLDSRRSVMEHPMRDRLAFHVRKGGRVVRRLVYQISISTIATLAGAAATSLYLRSPDPAPPVAASRLVVGIDPASAAGLIGGAFTPAGLRARPAYPVEFAAFPSLSLSSEWKTALSGPPATAQAVMAPAAIPAAASRAPCAGECDRHAAARIETVLPPPRPDSLRPFVLSESASTQPEPTHQEPARLLGLQLPRWTPSGEAIASTITGTVAAWSRSIVGLIDGE